MKKRICAIVAIVMMVTAICGCSTKQTETKNMEPEYSVSPNTKAITTEEYETESNAEENVSGEILQEIVDIANTPSTNEVFSSYFTAAEELKNRFGLDLLFYVSADGVMNGTDRALTSYYGEIDDSVRALYFYYMHKDGLLELENAKEKAQEEGLDYDTYKENLQRAHTIATFDRNYSSYTILINNEAMEKLIAGINPEYSGFHSEEISGYCLEYFGSKDEWQRQYNDFIEREAKLLDMPMHKERPEIGMTETEVIQTSWGLPEEKNRTETANGISEQWVYSDNRYVYFEDGVVTAIQD